MVVLSDFQTFHAPSFGEEDFKFEIPAITLPTTTSTSTTAPPNSEAASDCSNQSSPTCYPSHTSSSSPHQANGGAFSPNTFSNSSYSNTQPLSHPSTDFLSHSPSQHSTNSCFSPSSSSACNGGVIVNRPPPAYTAPSHLQHPAAPPPPTLYHGSIQLQSSCQIYPPHQYPIHQHPLQHQQQQQGLGTPGVQFYQRTPATSHGLHYFNNNQLLIQNSGYGGAQHLPHFSQFIPPPMNMQHREPILSTMDKAGMVGQQLGYQNPQQQQQQQQQAGMAPGSSPSTLTSPSRDSDSSDDTPLSQLSLKRTAPSSGVTKPAGKKPKSSGSKKKKKKDPNEPQKPVSAYALFFRDTQAAIKNQNANATFGEVSKIVASMWDSLDEDTKGAYKKRTEVAKKEYLKQLAAYRASLVSQGANLDPAEFEKSPTISPERPVQTSPQHADNNAPPPQQQQPQQPIGSSSPPSLQSTAPLTHMPPTSTNQQSQQQAPPPSGPPTFGSAPMPNQSPPSMEQGGFYGNNQPGVGGPGMMGGMDPATAAAMCIRTGCEQAAIHSPNWDNEYCSNDCVVDHCRDVFTAWVAQRQAPGSTYASVK